VPRRLTPFGLSRRSTLKQVTPTRARGLEDLIEPVPLPTRGEPFTRARGAGSEVPSDPATDGWATVTVWKLVPAHVEVPLEHMIAVLDPSERDRAHKMSTAESRRTFVIAHACLREVLAAELRTAPAEVAFARAPGGARKPALADSTHGLGFSLSHTRGLILVALARGYEVGVDVEWRGRRVREAMLSGRHLNEAELAALARTPPAERVWRFLQLWTRKEAQAKLTGEGLLGAVRLDTEAPDLPGNARSDLRDLDLAPDHVGALAVGALSLDQSTTR
jgi:4'-phosphopantetheinyl transferase